MARRLPAPLAGAAAAAGAVGLLQAGVAAGVVDPFTVPLPTEVVASLPRLVMEEAVGSRLAATAGETVLAAGLAMLAGVGVGLWLHRAPRMRRAFEPWVAVLAAAPLVLAYPLFLVLFGRTPLAIVALGFAAAFAPVVLKTVDGFGAVRPVLLDVGRSLGMTGWAEFRLILLPAALPSLFTGLRLALAFGLINVVGVEFLVNLGGLGALINELSERYDLPGTWGAIGLVVLVSAGLFSALERVERWLRRG